MKLDIILRTCEKEVVKQRSDEATKKSLPRVCGSNRREMVLKCVTSLVQTINSCVTTNNIKLTVLDDNSIDSFLVELNQILSKCIKEVELVNLKTQGYKESAVEQFFYAANAEDMVYTIEDDYLHEENALNSLLIAYDYLTKKYSNQIVLYPYDCAGRYDIGREYLTILLYDGIRYWRQIRNTANTMFAHKSFFKNNFEMFKKMSLNFPDYSEDDYVNKLYENYETGEGKIKAFSPIPSVAYHLSFNEPAEIKTNHLSWRHLWDKIELGTSNEN
jgi:hypothetical protein